MRYAQESFSVHQCLKLFPLVQHSWWCHMKQHRFGVYSKNISKQGWHYFVVKPPMFFFLEPSAEILLIKIYVEGVPWVFMPIYLNIMWITTFDYSLPQPPHAFSFLSLVSHWFNSLSFLLVGIHLCQVLPSQTCSSKWQLDCHLIMFMVLGKQSIKLLSTI